MSSPWSHKRLLRNGRPGPGLISGLRGKESPGLRTRPWTAISAFRCNTADQPPLVLSMVPLPCAERL